LITDKTSIALVAMSAIFFSVFGMFLLVFAGGVSGLRFELPWFGSNYLAASLGILGLISVCGCTLFLSLTRHQSRLWYFGIPLGIALTVTSVSWFFTPLHLIPDSMLNQNTGQVALFLLAPCSALFFWSEKRMKNGGIGLMVIILLVSILSALLLYGLIFPPQYALGSKIGAGPTVSELYFWIYYMLGLPIIGSLFLSTALGLFRRDSKTGKPDMQKPAETP
jgi:hypothetical protein